MSNSYSLIWGIRTIQLEWPSAPNREFDRTPTIALKPLGIPHDETSKCWQPQVTNSLKSSCLSLISIIYIYISYPIVYANHPQECPKKCFAFLFAHVFSVPPNKTWLGLLAIWHLVISGVQIQPCPKIGSLPSHPKVLEFWWSAPERSGGFHEVDVSNWGQNQILKFS